ncbi:UNVERIFIED_CONTAM: 5-methyltetrahydrofolate--homocysteine methyltransferase [Acetivibrio alkalicellulosi]
MIIIGEKINASSKSIKAALDNKDAKFIQELAKNQHEAGALYVDINAGCLDKDEILKLEWLVNIIQEVSSVSFCIDSYNAHSIEAALKVNKNPKPIVNSITGEKERYKSIIPLVLKYNTYVIALCMDDNGMPESMDDRLTIANNLIENITKEGINIEDIFIDPLVRPIGNGTNYGIDALESIKTFKKEFPKASVVCGINNISFGVPARKLMNQAFLVSAMMAGIDAAIMDPLDKNLMSVMFATEALMGKDEYCMNYQMKFREGLFDI